MIIVVVGAGLAGCSVARILAEAGFKVEVFEKTDTIGGLCYDNEQCQIYGPHIFHTSNPDVINFVLRFAKWKPFCNRPIALTEYGEVRLPISVETMKDINKETLNEKTEIDKEKIFEAVIEGYSLKQWGKRPEREVLDRLKVYDGLSGSYFNDIFEGLPECGFTEMLRNMLRHPNIKVHFNTTLSNTECPLVWTGPIDEFEGFNEKIDWRGLDFQYSIKEDEGRLSPVLNICVDSDKRTRSTDMTMLLSLGGKSDKHIFVDEIPATNGKKYYPIVEESKREYIRLFIEKKKNDKVFFCGRSATASYLDMDEVIEQALSVSNDIIESLMKGE